MLSICNYDVCCSYTKPKYDSIILLSEEYKVFTKYLNPNIKVFVYSKQWSINQFYENLNKFLIGFDKNTLKLVGWIFDNKDTEKFTISLHENNFMEYTDSIEKNLDEIVYIINKIKPLMKTERFDLLSSNIKNNTEYEFMSRNYIESKCKIELGSSNSLNEWLIESHDFNIIGVDGYFQKDKIDALEKAMDTEEEVNPLPETNIIKPMGWGKIFGKIGKALDPKQNGLANALDPNKNGIANAFEKDVKNFFTKDLSNVFNKTIPNFFNKDVAKFFKSTIPNGIAIGAFKLIIYLYDNRVQIRNFFNKTLSEIERVFKEIILPIISAFDVFGLVQLGISIDTLINSIRIYQEYDNRIQSENDESDKIRKLALAGIITSTIEIIICITTLSLIFASWNYSFSESLNRQIFYLTAIILPITGSLGSLGVSIMNYIFFPNEENKQALIANATACGITITLGAFATPAGVKALEKIKGALKPVTNIIDKSINKYILAYSFRKLLPKTKWIASHLDNIAFDIADDVSDNLVGSDWIKSNLDNIKVEDLIKI